MATPREIAEAAEQRDIRNRWLLSSPALIIIFLAAIGPLFVVLLYSFMVKGDYGDVKFGQFSLDGWFNVFFTRDIFDDTLTFADAHLSILVAVNKPVADHNGNHPVFWLSNRLFHCHAAPAPARHVAVSGDHSVLDQYPHPHLCHAGGFAQ